MRDLNRKSALFILLLTMTPIWSGVAAPLRAQSVDQDWEKAAGGKQSFEVASVREDRADGQSQSNFDLDNGNAYWVVEKGDRHAPSGDLFSGKNLPLMRYITFAYKLGGTQELALRFDFYSGLKLHVPDWVKNDRYDIEARAPGPASKDQMRLMIQSLLADRFKLVVHWETRQAPVFALILDKPGKPGPQLLPHSADDDCSATDFRTTPENGAATSQPVSLSALPIPCGMIAHLPSSTSGSHRFGGRNVTLAMLASSLPTQTGLVTMPRPAIDKTGLAGGYNFALEWMPEDTSEVGNRESGGTFRDALKAQLGLKLKPEKDPVQVLVIDHVEQPSPN